MATGARRSLVSVDLSQAEERISDEAHTRLQETIAGFGAKLEEIQRQLPALELPFQMRETEMDTIRSVALELQANSEVVVILGTGGCQLAARCLVESFDTPLSADERRVVYIGHHLSPDHVANVLEELSHYKIGALACCIGEPPLEFLVWLRLLRSLLDTRHGRQEGQRRLVLVCDSACRTLQDLAKADHQRLFKISDKASTQHSAFTAVGLLPAAVAGIDITQVVEGARSLARSMDKTPFSNNPCFRYAACRHALVAEEGLPESLVLMDPFLHALGDWWRHLVGGNLPPGSQACPPMAVHLANDIYTLGTWYGGETPERVESFLRIGQHLEDLKIPGLDDDLDRLRGFAGRKVSELYRGFAQTVRSRHRELGMVTMELELQKLDAFSLGALLCFLETAVAVDRKLRGRKTFQDSSVALRVPDMPAVAETTG
ncbi:MAG: hypothetical protein HY319_05555 [Armatimonadetes bacterium]|nr:hypothetical protein [Armatimonadota bacterium]